MRKTIRSEVQFIHMERRREILGKPGFVITAMCPKLSNEPRNFWGRTPFSAAKNVLRQAQKGFRAQVLIAMGQHAWSPW